MILSSDADNLETTGELGDYGTNHGLFEHLCVFRLSTHVDESDDFMASGRPIVGVGMVRLRANRFRMKSEPVKPVYNGLTVG